MKFCQCVSLENNAGAGRILCPALLFRHNTVIICHTTKKIGDDDMSTVAEKIKPQFDTLPEDLKSYILEKNVNINDMTDLMKVLQSIADEAGNQ